MNYLIMGFRADGQQPGYVHADSFTQATDQYNIMRGTGLYSDVVIYRLSFANILQPTIFVVGATKEPGS